MTPTRIDSHGEEAGRGGKIKEGVPKYHIHSFGYFVLFCSKSLRFMTSQMVAKGARRHDPRAYISASYYRVRVWSSLSSVSGGGGGDV